MAALKAEVARATDNARMFARAADTEKGNAAGFRAEVARLAGLAREACDALAEASEWNADNVASSIKVTLGGERQYLADCGDDIANLRAAIPTPDPAAFVAAVERIGQARAEWSRLDHDADEDEAVRLHTEMLAARDALLALGGAR